MLPGVMSNFLLPGGDDKNLRRVLLGGGMSKNGYFFGNDYIWKKVQKSSKIGQEEQILITAPT